VLANKKMKKKKKKKGLITTLAEHEIKSATYLRQREH